MPRFSPPLPDCTYPSSALTEVRALLLVLVLLLLMLVVVEVKLVMRCTSPSNVLTCALMPPSLQPHFKFSNR